MPKNSRKQRNASSNPNIEKDRYLAWVTNPSLLVAIASIIASTTIGILSIINTKAIARLDKDIYIPKLQYRVGQQQIGSLFIEISNYGQISAQDVVVSFSWKEINLKECWASPPYQNIKPVEPVVSQNFSYRLETLPVGGVLVINCKLSKDIPEGAKLSFFLSQYNVVLPPKLQHTLTPSSATKEFPTPISAESWTSQDDSSYKESYVEIDIKMDMLNISVIADNSMPAIEVGQRGKFLTAIQLLPSTITATPTFIP